MYKIAVTGLGASGLFAAKAAHDMGHKVTVFQYGDTQMPPGAFWFHWLPKDVAKQHKAENIWVIGKGSEKTYSARQWGLKYLNVKSSFPKTGYWAKGYNPQKVADDLLPTEINVEHLAYKLSDVDILDILPEFDLLFRTFPTKDSKEVQPKLLPFVTASKFEPEHSDKNFVVYNGTKEGIVVRETRLFGWHYLEFPKNTSPLEITTVMDLDGYEIITLYDMDPVGLSYAQYPHPKIKLIGRWAEWNRKRLSHEVYDIAQNHIRELG